MQEKPFIKLKKTIAKKKKESMEILKKIKKNWKYVVFVVLPSALFFLVPMPSYNKHDDLIIGLITILAAALTIAIPIMTAFSDFIEKYGSSFFVVLEIKHHIKIKSIINELFGVIGLMILMVIICDSDYLKNIIKSNNFFLNHWRYLDSTAWAVTYFGFAWAAYEFYKLMIVYISYSNQTCTRRTLNEEIKIFCQEDAKIGNENQEYFDNIISMRLSIESYFLLKAALEYNTWKKDSLTSLLFDILEEINKNTTKDSLNDAENRFITQCIHGSLKLKNLYDEQSERIGRNECIENSQSLTYSIHLAGIYDDTIAFDALNSLLSYSQTSINPDLEKNILPQMINPNLCYMKNEESIGRYIEMVDSWLRYIFPYKKDLVMNFIKWLSLNAFPMHGVKGDNSKAKCTSGCLKKQSIDINCKPCRHLEFHFMREIKKMCVNLLAKIASDSDWESLFRILSESINLNKIRFNNINYVSISPTDFFENIDFKLYGFNMSEEPISYSKVLLAIVSFSIACERNASLTNLKLVGLSLIELSNYEDTIVSSLGVLESNFPKIIDALEKNDLKKNSLKKDCKKALIKLKSSIEVAINDRTQNSPLAQEKIDKCKAIIIESEKEYTNLPLFENLGSSKDNSFSSNNNSTPDFTVESEVNYVRQAFIDQNSTYYLPLSTNTLLQIHWQAAYFFLERNGSPVSEFKMDMFINGATIFVCSTDRASLSDTIGIEVYDKINGKGNECMQICQIPTDKSDALGLFWIFEKNKEPDKLISINKADPVENFKLKEFQPGKAKDEPEPEVTVSFDVILKSNNKDLLAYLPKKFRYIRNN
jgi:hypothetical protein